MNTIATLKTTNLRLVAKDPEGMISCQHNLSGWLSAKTNEVRDELNLIRENIKLAKEAGLVTASLKRLESKAKQRFAYYHKLYAAIEAGYYIIPNMPMDVFAIRTAANAPRHVVDRWKHSFYFRQNGQKLPQGEGRYVSSDISLSTHKDGDKTLYTSDQFLPVEFPVALVRPEVMGETTKALALNLFDEIGIVRDRPKADPMVVGKILDPRGNGREVSFLIAWWFDTDMIK